MLYLLRMQRERMTEALVPSLREYTTRFGLTPSARRRLPEHALVMHPGPMNRGVEIIVDPAELPGAVITQQVTNGVAVRMAVLFDLLGAERAIERRATMETAAERRRDRHLIAAAACSTRPGSGRPTCVVDGRIAERRRRPRRRRRDDPRRHRLRRRPGFVDLHAHLREPGHEEAETIETGSRAAALGGFTAVVAMPNTDPTQDSRRRRRASCAAQGAAAGLCEVLPAGCITDRAGRGSSWRRSPSSPPPACSIFTDDGNGVQDPLLMRRAIEYSLGLDIMLAQHCEVARLTEGAVMHEGRAAAGSACPAGRRSPRS